MIAPILALMMAMTAGAQERNERLFKFAENDAKKLETALMLNKEQYEKILDYQYVKYVDLDRIKKADMTDDEKRKASNKVHKTYSDNARSVMTPEQLEKFVEYRRRQQQKKEQRDQKKQ